jgi:alpha-tubulin suppressor-like RCC1 family protein
VIIGLLTARGIIHSYERSIIMLTGNYSSTVNLWAKSFMLVTGLLSLLVTLPAVSQAATPWYSHGGAHTLALTEDGKVWALGENNFGQLGNGSFGGEAAEPIMVNKLDGVVAVLAGNKHSVALKKDGTVWTWGYNGSGQLGDGTTRHSSVPDRVAGISNVKAIASGSGHIVALKNDGTVWAWGGNQSGQIGNGEYVDSKTPVQVSGLGDVTAIAAGAFNTSALRKDGTLWSWGFNGKGQLGNGGNERSSSPVRVSGLDDVHAIAAGDWHVVALRHDGTVWAWGSNHASQLGSTAASYSFSPVQVAGLHNIADITASVGHTIAIASNNTVWAWGDAGTGQWGNGTSLEGSVSPVQVAGYNGLVTVASVVNPDSVLKHMMEGSSMLADAGTSRSTIANIKRSEVFITASR